MCQFLIGKVQHDGSAPRLTLALKDRNVSIPHRQGTTLLIRKGLSTLEALIVSIPHRQGTTKWQ